ncbi:MAG: TIGR04283 family arsenosugar biosynthesis glycosyltransferase [Mariprofundaceae bacterium]|nr:TIGR04283 family arsenosugar biosynthesis glycosyltransferase [Mariprofundaceae bacterium]
MSVAIIVPVYNEEKTLGTFLPLLEKFACDQLIIVDGGSQDASQARLKKQGITWVQGRKGRAKQMNDGAAGCTSDVLLFLHVDTQLPPRAIEFIQIAMQDRTTVGGRFDVRLDGKEPVFRLIETLINWRSRLSRISTGDQAMFVRRHVFERVGGFAEQALMEDIALSRCLKRHGKIACLRHTVTTSARRWQYHGVMRTVLLMWRLRFLYWCGVNSNTLAAMYHDAR